MNIIGTTVRGLRAPIIREGDNLVKIVVNTVLEAAKEGNFQLKDKDIIGITESIVARAQGNYATVYDIAEDITEKFGTNQTIVLYSPILSRNRFAICLKGIAKAAKKIVLILTYPTDEVGNALMTQEQLFYYNHNSLNDEINIDDYHQYFGDYKHPFTNINYVDYYKQIIESEDTECEVCLCNDPFVAFRYSKNIINCRIHQDSLLNDRLIENGAKVFNLNNILNKSINNFGYNEQYGLLGSNKVNETTIKLFPRNGQQLVEQIQKELEEQTGVRLEVMIYGDGAFCDPVGQIWELADPVVSPAYTKGLAGTPNELKLKYLADNQFANLNGESLKEALINSIKEKDNNLLGKMESQGTTPRRYTDLLGSLCDLTSGSGDKGTPIVLIQNYFENYAS